MGGLSIGLFDASSTHNNPAEILRLEGPNAQVFWKNSFSVEGINRYNLLFSLPLGNDAFGLDASYFGYENYSEQRLGINYARKLGEPIGVALQLDFQSLDLGEFGSSSIFTFDLSVYYEVLDNLIIGAHIYNPLQSSYGLSLGGSEQSSGQMDLGLSYRISEKVLVGAGFEKDVDHNGRFKGGIEYGIIPVLDLRLGFSSQPDMPTFGFGLNLKDFEIDFSAEVHQPLGISPSFSIGYGFP